MDLAALQLKINNYITVVSSWVRNVGKLYFSGTPENVTVELIDDNGNLVTKTLPNVAQFRKTVWDDVGGALGQFNKTFYVDEINGDDSNAGASSSPFKTLKKATDSTPIGGTCNIILLSDLTQNYSFSIEYKNVYVSMQNYNINFTVKDSDGNTINNIQLKGTRIQLYGGIVNIPSPLNNPTSTSNDDRFVFATRGAVLSFYNVSFNIGSLDGSEFITIGQYSWNSENYELEVEFLNTNVVCDGLFVYFTNCGSIGGISALSVTNNAGDSRSKDTSLIGGVIKDSNGALLNINADSSL